MLSGVSESLLEEASTRFADMSGVDPYDAFEIIGAQRTDIVIGLYGNSVHAIASSIENIFLVQPRLGFCVHMVFKHRQQCHVFFLSVWHERIDQLLPELTELSPTRGIETVSADFADELYQRRTDRTDNRVFVGQVRADPLVARRFEIRKKLRFFDGEMTLHFSGE